MIVGKEMIGLAVYHATDLRDNPTLLRELLAAAAVAAGPGAVAYMHGQFASSDRFSRQQKITESRIEQLLTDIRGGVFRSVQFAELPRPEQETSLGYVSLQLELNPAANPKVSSTDRPIYPFRIHMLVPRAYAGRAEQVEEGLVSLARIVRSQYAFAHVAKDFRDALMEVTSTPMFPWGQPLSPADLRRQKRLQRCQIERVHIGRVACGAYWANILGNRIIAQLGGVERVRHEAPVPIVHEHGSDTLYLQVSNDLPQREDSDYRRALEKLEAYLQPVSVMQAKTAR